MTSRMKNQWERDTAEKSELEAILRATSSNLEQTKKRLTECEFDLREAKFELHQLTGIHSKAKEERIRQDQLHRSEMAELAAKAEASKSAHNEKAAVIAMECERITKLLETFCLNHDGRKAESICRTKRHLLDKAQAAVNKIHALAATNGSAQHTTPAPRTKLKNADVTVDSAMLDMCRNLEDENAALAEQVEALKAQLSAAQREASASQLIPHYRLAIVRAKSYAANLAEQIVREQATASALREQLDETYRDLKKVAEDKRQLYKRINKTGLLQDQRGCRDRLQEDADEAEGRRARHKDRDRDSGGDSDGGNEPGSSSKKGRHHPPHQQHLVDHLGLGLAAHGELEAELQNELLTLDDQIESLKQRLGKAAMVQSQRILSDVIGSSLSQLSSSISSLKP